MRRRVSLIGVAALSLSLASSPGWAASSQPAAAPQAVGAHSKAVEKSKTGSYIVVMKSDPLVKSIPTSQLRSAKSAAKRAHVVAEQDAVLAKAGLSKSRKLTSFQNALNGFAVRTDLAGAQRLAANPDVAVVLPDELRQKASVPATSPTTTGAAASDNTLYNFLGLTKKGEAWASGITGDGVLVGVIDTGIWPEHPSFKDNGTFPAAPALENTPANPSCNFGNTAANANDAVFTCNNKLVGAREFLSTYQALTGLGPFEFDSARDDDGHGTHTASTAAGDANVSARIFGVPKGTISGIAPRAQVIAYKALGEAGGYTSDLTAAIDQAVADGVDVINYSVGGGAATISAETLAFLFAADAGVFSAVSAGNSGPDASTIGGPADVPWVTGVGANTHRTFYKGTIQLGNGKTYRGSSVTRGTKWAKFVDAANAGGDLCLADSLDPAVVKGKIVLCRRGGNGRVAKSYEVERAGGIGMVLYNATDVDTLFSDSSFVPTVMIDNTPGLAIKAWVNTARFPVGRLQAGGIGTAPFYSPTMAYFSSRGENPTAGDIIKPDITAPGVQIMAGDSPMPIPGSQPQGELFQAIAGTSMSSPVVAGSYALLKQAHPDWTPAMAKSALMTAANTKVHDYDRVSQAGPFAMGAGMAMVGKPAAAGSAFKPGLVYDAGFYDYLGFLCAEGREAFGNPDQTCASLAADGIPTRAADLNYPSIGVEAVPGATTVTRTVTSVASARTTFVASVSAPAGYRVKVTPSRLTLAPGATATFTVKLTSTGSAPFGEWRFGSLTWKSACGFAVRSPIAVKGVEIAAPATVSGTGATGTVSVPVQFGFAGSYSAVPHGLVAPTDTAGTISQDPDQTFPSADDGAGVDTIPFTLNGVALARWSLVLPTEDDLDMYLLGPDGTEVARSTNGGTNEQIELTKPSDGTYTLVVHGWAVGTPDLPYTLQSWLVPSTTGGSLTIANGGTATATIGGTHTVDLAWSGLTAGTSYLGAVSHHNGTNEIGMTAVLITG